MSQPSTTVPALPPYDFGWALAQLRFGNKVKRTGWNGQGMWVALQSPANVTSSSPINFPYLYMYTSTGQTVPWVACQTDLLSIDWTLA